VEERHAAYERMNLAKRKSTPDHERMNSAGERITPLTRRRTWREGAYEKKESSYERSVVSRRERTY